MTLHRPSYARRSGYILTRSCRGPLYPVDWSLLEPLRVAA